MTRLNTPPHGLSVEGAKQLALSVARKTGSLWQRQH